MALTMNANRYVTAALSGALVNTQDQHHYIGMWVKHSAANNVQAYYGLYDDDNATIKMRAFYNTAVDSLMWAQAAGGGIATTNDIYDLPDALNNWALYLIQLKVEEGAGSTWNYAASLIGYDTVEGEWGGTEANFLSQSDVDEVATHAIFGAYSHVNTTAFIPLDDCIIADAFIISKPDEVITSAEYAALKTMVPHLAMEDPTTVLGHWTLDGTLAANYGTLPTLVAPEGTAYSVDAPSLIRSLGADHRFQSGNDNDHRLVISDAWDHRRDLRT